MLDIRPLKVLCCFHFFEFSILSSITYKESVFFFSSCMFSFTKKEVSCSQNVNLSNIPMRYSCMNIVSVHRDILPPELQEDVVRTWTKALESLVVKLVLREVDDAFLFSGRLFWVSQEVLVA